MILKIRQLDQRDYLDTWQAMRSFTLERQAETLDECWLLEHFPVFTQGQNGSDQHIINLHDIPLVKTDRGGQITYHGLGQLIIYPLLDLKRLHLSVHGLVSTLENVMVNFLLSYGLDAFADPKARGVYIQENGIIKKIASIGLRIKRGCSYHGIAFNHEPDLTPFQYIHPCGLTSMPVTSLKEQGVYLTSEVIYKKLISSLAEILGYTKIIWST